MTYQDNMGLSLLTDSLEAVGRAIPAALLVCGVASGIMGLVPLAGLSAAAAATMFLYPHLEPMEPPVVEDTPERTQTELAAGWMSSANPCNCS